MRIALRKIARSRKAELITIILLTVQLAGCVADMTSRQITLGSGFCMVTDNRALSAAAIGIGTVLVFSWVVGLVGLRCAGVRPVYWTLLIMIPLAVAAQQRLLDRGILSCDMP